MKKTLVVFSFLALFLFPQPAFAAGTQGGGLFDFLINFFKGITSYVSKDPSINLDATQTKTKENFTTYSKDKDNPNDITTRGLSDNSRIYKKGQHIEDIITNFYSDPNSPNIDEEDDKILAAACNNSCVRSDQASSNCRDIRISEVAYFFLTQNDSTSYDLNGEVLTKKPYSSQIQDRLNQKYKDKISLVDSQCYYKLYDQITVAPKSNNSDKAQENTGISDQLNKVEKTLVPKTHGDQPSPSLGFFDSIANFFSGGKKELLKDNLYKEKVFLSDFTPDQKLNTISQDDNNQNLRDNFNKTMQPASWQIEGIVDTDDSSTSYDPDYPTAVVSYVSPPGFPLYVFETTTGGGRMKTRYDLGLTDPEKLGQVPSEFRAQGASNTMIDIRVIPAYTAMVKAARAAGFPADELNLISGYRSIAQQQVLWDNSDKTGKFVARPGGSPHHSGRAVDIVVNGGTTHSGGIANQKNSATYRWLALNAASFGFYNYLVEPWHWEYNPKAP